MSRHSLTLCFVAITGMEMLAHPGSTNGYVISRYHPHMCGGPSYVKHQHRSRTHHVEPDSSKVRISNTATLFLLYAFCNFYIKVTNKLSDEMAEMLAWQKRLTGFSSRNLPCKWHPVRRFFGSNCPSCSKCHWKKKMFL